MRVYLVDGSNAVRRRHYDPRFPAVEERRTAAWLARIDRLAVAASGRFEVEVYFDGPRRDVGGPYEGLRIRFSAEARADDAILDAVRHLSFRPEPGKGGSAVVVTEDSGLAADAEAEGARVLRFAGFEDKLASGRA